MKKNILPVPFTWLGCIIDVVKLKRIAYGINTSTDLKQAAAFLAAIFFLDFQIYSSGSRKR